MLSRCLRCLCSLLIVIAFPLPISVATASPSGTVAIELSSAPAERAAAVSGVAPILVQPSDMTLTVGETADQTLYATDADGDPLTFSKAFGPTYMTVTTTDPGAGTATGNVHLAPGPSDTGMANAGVGVTDGLFADQASFQIKTTLGPPVAPVLTQPQDMTMGEGESQSQLLYASDANGDSLGFYLASGPAYAIVTTLDPGAGNGVGEIVALPGFGSNGTVSATVGVSDGVLTDEKVFSITVTRVNATPVLTQPSDMNVLVGEIKDQVLSANDPNGDSVAFSKVSGPAYMTVTTVDSVAGIGNVRLNPGSSDVGAQTVIVMVTDGALSDQKSFVITVVRSENAFPFLQQPFDMFVNEGATADQTLFASDPDGDPLSFGKNFGPDFMTVTTTSPGTGSATGDVHLAPNFQDDGFYFASVFVSDGSLSDVRFFFITVNNVPPPPVPGQPIWEVAAPFSDPRTFSGVEGACASLIGDKIYVSHGYRSGDRAYLSIYDIVQDQWTHGGSVAPDAMTPRSEMAGGVAGGKHFAIGGRSGPNAQVEEFDPGTSRWATRAPMGVARGGLGAASWNERIYAVGGRTGSTYGVGPIFNRLEAYDPAVDRWTTLAAMPKAVSDCYATVAYQGRVYVLGGTDGIDEVADVQIYDIATNRWHFGTPMPTARGAAMAGVIGGKIAVFGGYDGTRNLSTTEFYDPATDSWERGPEMPFTASEIAQGVTFDSRGIFSIGSGIFGASSQVVMVLRPLIQVIVPKIVSVDEGQPLHLDIVVVHRNGLPVSLSASGLPVGASFADHGDGTAQLDWTPGFDQAGVYAVTIRGDDAQGATNLATVTITVRNANRAPRANAGGPYTSFAALPVELDGTGSSDPDGDVLTFSWIFGDGTTGSGPKPMHTYAAIGVYGVALTVSDGTVSDLATTTTTVVGLFDARAFTVMGNRSIRLSAGKPIWCAEVEPIGRAFSLDLVDVSSIVMKSVGTGTVSEIRAVQGKTSVGSDRDANGVEEISACFAKDDLRLLFSSVHGTTTATVTIEGSLFTGGLFRARLDVSVIGSGGGLAAAVSPNPLNPAGVLTIYTPQAGPARVRVYDPRGRLVRALLDEYDLPAGYHDVRIDGRSQDGTQLSSGAYYYLVETAAGRASGGFVILK